MTTITELKKLLFFYDSKNTNMAGPPSSQSELSHEHTYPVFISSTAKIYYR